MMRYREINFKSVEGEPVSMWSVVIDTPDDLRLSLRVHDSAILTRDPSLPAIKPLTEEEELLKIIM